jgi:hypothetical protein
LVPYKHSDCGDQALQENPTPDAVQNAHSQARTHFRLAGSVVQGYRTELDVGQLSDDREGHDSGREEQRHPIAGLLYM